jgi:DNA-binding MarR family transcriptional regulator
MVKKGRSRGGPPSGDRNPMRMYRGLLSGERNGNAKFNRTQIDEIRSAHERGETQVSIAARYGVRQSDISRIVRFEAWK